MFEAAIKKLQKAYGPEHFEVALVLNNLAGLLYKQVIHLYLNLSLMGMPSIGKTR